MIDSNIRDAVDAPVSGHRNDRHGKWMLKHRVNGDEGLRTSAEQHAAVLFHQVLPMSMMGGEVKISRLHQMIADAAHHLGVVSVAQLRHQYSNG